MPNIERKVIIDVSQPDEALVQLRASLRLPDDQIRALIAHLKDLESETTKLVTQGITPTKDGLATLSASFKSNVQEAASLSSALRQLIVAQNAVAASTRGSAESQKAELVERRVALQQIGALQQETRRIAQQEQAERARALQQIAAAQETVRRSVQAENEERKKGLQQISASVEDAKRAAGAEAQIRTVGIRQVVAAQEDLNRSVIQERNLRTLALQQIQAQRANLEVTAARQRELIPANAIDAFNRAMLGGVQGVKQFQEAQNNAQTAARTFSSVLIAHPVQALRMLFTDARAAGAGVAFLKAQLDFIINSRFGSIALGFAIFGTAISTISRLTSELVKFEQEFSRIQALSLGQADAAQVNAKSQSVLRDTAVKTGISLGELTKQFREALQATGDITVAEALFTSALQLSIVAGTDFTTTLNQLSGVFNVFGPQLGTAISAQDKLRLITSQLFQAFGEGRARPDDFIQAIKFVGAQASLSGISLTRTLAIIHTLGQGFQEGSRGGRGFSQVLSTISSEAQKFNERFSLGFTEGQITESPLLAITELMKRIEDGRLSVSRFRAEVTDLFPQNAERILLTFQKLGTQLDQVEAKIRAAHDIAKRTEIVLNTTGTAFRQLGTIALETFIGAVGGADAFRSTMLLTAQVVGAVGAGVVFIATGINQVAASVAGMATIVLAISDDLSRSDLTFSVTREAAKLVAAQIQAIGDQGLASGQRLLSLGNDALKAAGDFDELKKKAKEADEAFQEQVRARIAAGKTGLDPTPRMQIELDLLNGIKVSLERRLTLQREIVAKAEEAFRTAAKSETQERAFKTLIEERKRLIELELSASKEALEEQKLRSDQITESHRRSAVVTEGAARSEIRARRGIIAEIQQQQAALLRLIETNRISEQAARQQLDALQKFLNQQLQTTRQIEDAARRDAQQRVQAFRRERDAGENLAELQLRQAQQRVDAETTIRKARERVLKDTRQLEDQQRKTLETQAQGRVRLLLGFPGQANDLLLVQLDRLREAQQIANLPLQDRHQLLLQELELLERLKGKEEDRLDQEILFGEDFNAIMEAKREAVEGFLAASPASRRAAEKKALSKFGRITPEGVLAAGAGALRVTGLEPDTADEEHRNLQEIEGIGQRRVQLQNVIRQQTAEEVKKSRELEREKAETLAESRIALERAIRENAELLRKEPREFRKGTEALQDAHQERLRIEREFREAEENERSRALADRPAEQQRELAAEEAQINRELAARAAQKSKELSEETAQINRELAAKAAQGIDVTQESAQRKKELEEKAAQISRDLAEEATQRGRELTEKAERIRRDLAEESAQKVIPARPMTEQITPSLPGLEEADRESMRLDQERENAERQNRLLEEQQRRGIPRLAPQSFQFQESLEAPLIRANVEMGRLREQIDLIEQRLPAVMARTGQVLTTTVEEKITDRLSRELLFPTGAA